METSQAGFVWPELVNPWKKASQPFKTAFLSACFFGVITHIYVFTNLILNHDSVWRLYYDNNNLALGRWLLQFLSEFSTRFQLPVVIAVISIVMLALTAGLTVSFLEISNKVIVVLTAAFLVTIPSVACIFSYMFTADAYFTCLFFNALAAYCAKKYYWGWLPAIILCAFACGGYQAFICYSVGLFLVDCIIELLTDSPVQQVVCKGVKYIAIVVASLTLYYVVLMMLLHLKGVALSSYQGLDSITDFQVEDLLEQIPRAYRDFIQYFKAPEFSISVFQIIQSLFLLLAFGALVYLIVARHVYRDWLRIALLLTGMALLPMALNFITILSMGEWVHALMIYSFVLLDILALKLCENALKKMIESNVSDWPALSLSCVLLSGLLIWNNFCISNMAYLRLQVCYENSFALANRIVARIEILDNYSPDLPVAVIGEASQTLYGGTVGEFAQINSLTGTNDKLLYSPEPHIRTRTFIEHYIGLHMPKPNNEQKKLLNDSEFIEELPSYPQEGSVAIYEGIVVVKLSEGTVQ